MNYGDRMTKYMHEIQRDRQRRIDDALMNGSRPGLNDRGRVILVPRGDDMTKVTDDLMTNPAIAATLAPPPVTRVPMAVGDVVWQSRDGRTVIIADHYSDFGPLSRLDNYYGLHVYHDGQKSEVWAPTDDPDRVRNLVTFAELVNAGIRPITFDRYKWVPSELWRTLTFKVYRDHDRRATWNELWLGAGSCYCLVDYGACHKQSDRELIRAARDHSGPQWLNVMAPDYTMCDHVGIFVHDQGYRVRAVFV